MWLWFQGAPVGVGLLTAGVVLAIMILPFIAAATRDVLLDHAAAAEGWRLRHGRDALGGADRRRHSGRARLAVRRGLSRARPRARRDDGGDVRDRQRQPHSRQLLCAPTASIASIVANDISRSRSPAHEARRAVCARLHAVRRFVLRAGAGAAAAAPRKDDAWHEHPRDQSRQLYAPPRLFAIMDTACALLRGADRPRRCSALILCHADQKGCAALSLHIFTHAMRATPGQGGGLANAIVGS